MFDLEIFDIKLDTDFIGRNFVYCNEVESTNKMLTENNQLQQNNGTVILAEKQLSGKGRKGRTWQSARGLNLTFSILLTNIKPFEKNINLITFASALAVSHSIENLYQLKTELKWPNDVLINNKKVCGILLESSSKGKKITKIITGIGINVNQNLFQGEYRIKPTSIKLESGNNIEREKLLAEILNNFEEILNRLNKEPELVLRDWKARCKMIGEKIVVEEGDIQKYGIFDDIDADGFLLLRSNKKIEKILSGDVSLL